MTSIENRILEDEDMPLIRIQSTFRPIQNQGTSWPQKATRTREMFSIPGRIEPCSGSIIYSALHR